MHLSRKQINEIVDYWQKSAERDFETFLFLYKNKRYSDSLYFGHITLEKILKSFVVKKINTEAPKIHDLVRLEEISGLGLDEDTRILLKEINVFNINARYPDYKFRFYKSCTKDFTKEYIEKISELYKSLCQKLKQKK